ncbi:hypothetical protein PO908_02780 [Streptococcus anginosus]|uniref:hypothetical protein n=1 Tax=Streptococcus anginosus TaxID=1328 RepID=UPI002907A22C|nr:hypothetical protein [Streptococcus anginosus]
MNDKMQFIGCLFATIFITILVLTGVFILGIITMIGWNIAQTNPVLGTVIILSPFITIIVGMTVSDNF